MGGPVHGLGASERSQPTAVLSDKVPEQNLYVAYIHLQRALLVHHA